MTAYTDDDVTAAQSAWRQVFGGYAAGEEIETVLAAVAPQIAARVWNQAHNVFCDDGEYCSGHRPTTADDIRAWATEQVGE